ncbi:hypothetical protein B5E56_06180 [Flavonifractor sp. An112]|nr:hypothetical protein B5E56_06180 [Flavonifractor sp. An112]
MTLRCHHLKGDSKPCRERFCSCYQGVAQGICERKCRRNPQRVSGDLSELFPEVKFQRFTVRVYRNMFSVALRSKVKLVVKMLKEI